MMRNWKGPWLFTLSTILEKVMVPSKRSQSCGQGTRTGRGMCACVRCVGTSMGVGVQVGWRAKVYGNTSVWDIVCISMHKGVGPGCVCPQIYGRLQEMDPTACTDEGSPVCARSGSMGGCVFRLELEGTVV